MELTLKFWSSLLMLQLFIIDEAIWTSAEGIPSLAKCGMVHLTVSSQPDNYLEMNWITKCDTVEEQPDFIALYGQDPRTQASRPLQSIVASEYEGYFKTNVKFGTPTLPGEWDYYDNITEAVPGPHCFPFWIASVRKNRIIDLNCFKIHPTWMGDNRTVLGVQRIGAMFLPGTHNSGAYGGTSGFLEKYILNQDMDIWTQLVFGVRYLDLRVGYYENEGFFINHDLVRIRRLEPHLRTIRKFLELAPKEVIVLDFHRFPYPTMFPTSIHTRLLNLIHRELGHLILPPDGWQIGKGPTLNEIWQHNKSIIICYGHRKIAREHTSLWNPIQQYWGDKKDAADLKRYILSSIKTHNTISNPLWALMAELTISPIDVIFNSASNKNLADKINRELTKWFRDEWAKDVNIVASDYFLGNDLINIAIEVNKLK